MAENEFDVYAAGEVYSVYSLNLPPLPQAAGAANNVFGYQNTPFPAFDVCPDHVCAGGQKCQGQQSAGYR